MTARLSHVSDNEVTQDEVKYLEKEGKDYCMAHGMVYKDSKGETQHIPFTLYPSPIPLKLFADAKEVQTDFNLLVHKVSRDYEFTKNALLSTVAADPFTSRLFDIYEKVWEQGNAQSVSLGIFRSDYLIETTGWLQHQFCSYSSIKQVEMNTISIGGISFSCLVPDMHRYLLHSMGRENKVPPNPALDEAADALIRAWELYGSDSAVIMFVVQPDEINVYDQRLLEYRIHERNNAVKVIRRSLNDIFKDGKMSNDKSIFVTGIEVGVAYFRAGYTPKDYPTDQEWSARLTLELSRCIKCPTVAHHLMGTKKIQQVLSDPGVLERYNYEPLY
ncbi:glutathione synthetase, chloroplastic-like [Orbicella faveolata]|uniref:glutathione synthetase, chloroplastic-like n=1 Tax=Orbicella faveolata TaxID=48498 RepID=UPI0009E59B94|nr:glutathione synthetase, chloroplastic-like [Orbicella faveolata]